MEAAGLFAAGMSPPQVARKLRVSRKSAYVWHKAWRTAGAEALESKGPCGQRCRLSDAQVERLEAALNAGPAVWGWTEDQRWTLARVTVLVGRLFHVSYTPRGISYLLHRLGWSPQAPQRRVAERDEEAIATWIKETWPLVEQRRGTRRRGSASKTKQASR
ncbi:winged helix-turn-helix domain-containing protein [Nonomuraea polychroma]|uniref:winged helix-turn-helix domain-containing protein n=1 Tax=Nonomuraea polychroma TaxID=46176 RepID=UPI001F4D83BD